ncbi:MAG: DUF2092 domain-containing protein [Bacteroidales bacterium]|nr:DUF2092 domain-containing protein [Bacteroidales bacterium]
MKKFLYCLVFLGLVSPTRSQEKSYDTTAIVILDHMSAIIGDLSSCYFRLSSESDGYDPDFGLLTSHRVSNVWFSGPDRMLVESWGDKGHRGYWYNGQTLTWYSFTENNYVVINVPDQTIVMMDSVNQIYGIDFPAADFFYPTFTDDLIEQSDYISYQGKTIIDGQSCFQIVARNEKMTVQIWITDEVLFLPLKMVIGYHGESHIQRYEVTFLDWKINPGLPDALFEFALPPGAHQVSILPGK